MNGVVNVLKPPSMSSNGVTVYLKRLLDEKRVGHAGTLDPGAVGVLVVLLGRSSRLSDYLMGHDKTYIAEMHLGCTTDTLDSYGAICKQQTPKQAYTVTQIQQAADGFVGEITQIPPAYSAIKVDGKKSYELARKGINVQKAPRKITIHDIRVLEQTGPMQFLMEIRCSKGTYIRTLLEDIAASIGELAYTSLLVRSCSGDHDISRAYTLDEIAAMVQAGDDSFCVPPEQVVADLPKVYLQSNQKFAVENGQRLRYTGELPQGQFALYCGDTFYGIGIAEDGCPKLKIPLY